MHTPFEQKLQQFSEIQRNFIFHNLRTVSSIYIPKWTGEMVYFCLVHDRQLKQGAHSWNLQILRHCVGLLLFNASKVVVGRVLRLWRNPHWQQNASFDSLLSRAGLGHLGKGWIVRDTTTIRLPYWVNGLFYTSWNRCTDLQLISSSCGRLPSTDLTHVASTTSKFRSISFFPYFQVACKKQPYYVSQK